MFVFMSSNKILIINTPNIIKNDIFYDKNWIIIKNINIKDIEQLAEFCIGNKYYKITYNPKISRKIKQLLI